MPNPKAKPQKREEDETKRKRGQAPGKSIEARENQIISLAYDLVEERIRKKTATSQEVTQFIKAGSSTAQLEKLKLKHETELLEAKAEALKSQKKIEELYEKAMKAFRGYQGVDDESDDYDPE